MEGELPAEGESDLLSSILSVDSRRNHRKFKPIKKTNLIKEVSRMKIYILQWPPSIPCISDLLHNGSVVLCPPSKTASLVKFLLHRGIVSR